MNKKTRQQARVHRQGAENTRGFNRALAWILVTGAMRLLSFLGAMFPVVDADSALKDVSSAAQRLNNTWKLTEDVPQGHCICAGHGRNERGDRTVFG